MKMFRKELEQRWQVLSWTGKSLSVLIAALLLCIVWLLIALTQL